MCAPFADPRDFPPPARDRLRLWEIPSSFHCAILGTCLGLDELVRIGRKAGIVPDRGATDYEVHGWFARHLGEPSRLTRLLQKHLDRTHRGAIEACREARDDAALAAFWRRSLAAGDVAGPFWALIAHPLATGDLRSLAYGDVHMLSHWMGSANRGVARRLRAAEAREARLAGKLARQAEAHGRKSDRQAREADALARRLEAAERRASALPALEMRLAELERGEAHRALGDENAALAAELREARRAGDARSRRCAELERALAALRRAHEEAAARLAEAEAERAALEAVLTASADAEAPAVDLCGRRIAYVGGREAAVRHFRDLVERSNGRFSHHDGTTEGAAARLDRVLHQADVVLCPVDCVSHGACLKAKKFCKRTAKTFVPLRSASLSSLIAGLNRAVGEPGAPPPGAFAGARE